jgi:hypothetical protein
LLFAFLDSGSLLRSVRNDGNGIHPRNAAMSRLHCVIFANGDDGARPRIVAGREDCA